MTDLLQNQLKAKEKVFLSQISPHSRAPQCTHTQLTQCSFNSSHSVQLERFSNTSWKQACLHPHVLYLLEGDAQFLLEELLLCPVPVPPLTAGQAAHPWERVGHCLSRHFHTQGTISRLLSKACLTFHIPKQQSRPHRINACPWWLRVQDSAAGHKQVAAGRVCHRGVTNSM